MTAGKNYRDLLVWQRAIDLAAGVYELTRSFPADERFGLIAQLRRAAVSIPSNIAEGQGRGSKPDFVRFLRIGYGSLREVETQLLLARRLEFVAGEQIEPLLSLCAEVGRLLNRLVQSQEHEES